MADANPEEKRFVERLFAADSPYFCNKPCRPAQSGNEFCIKVAELKSILLAVQADVEKTKTFQTLRQGRKTGIMTLIRNLGKEDLCSILQELKGKGINEYNTTAIHYSCKALIHRTGTLVTITGVPKVVDKAPVFLVQPVDEPDAEPMIATLEELKKVDEFAGKTFNKIPCKPRTECWKADQILRCARVLIRELDAPKIGEAHRYNKADNIETIMNYIAIAESVEDQERRKKIVLDLLRGKPDMKPEEEITMFRQERW